MIRRVQDSVIQAIQATDGMYHRLVLLVGQAGSGKTSALGEVAKALGTEVINVNLVLSRELIELTVRQRTLRLSSLLSALLENGQPTVLLDNLEILFDPELEQDPLRLLKGISRNRTVAASWNGKMESGKLVYAEVGHPEYRRYDLDDALIVDMAETTTPKISEN